MIAIPGYHVYENLCHHLEIVTYRANRLEDDKPVLIKTPYADYPSLQTISRLEQEYELTSIVDSDNILAPLALLRIDNGMALIADDFGGTPLAGQITGQALPLADCLRIGIQLAEGVAAVHQANFIHNDISPVTIFVNPRTKHARICAFNLASEIGYHESLHERLAYVSPEQTGRMNRAVDQRSDLYSLGVVLYEMLTGAPPFSSNDALAVIHHHIAKEPVAPHHRDPVIPEQISAIVMKLLAKAAEDRYQSAYGLRSDLSQCLAALEERGAIAPFTIAGSDVCACLRLPSKVYGRSQERAALLRAFDRAANGQPTMALVSGYSGIGKSTLVRETQRAIAARHGYFVVGKFDQLSDDNPYGALARAFRDLVRQLLAGDPEQVATWRQRLGDALGKAGGVLAEVIPEIEILLGPQPAVESLAPIEAQQRFYLVFQRLARALARAEHPLVLFLDDLQWANAAALGLLRLLLTADAQQHLLLIAAYRSNEIHDAHPLKPALQEIETVGVELTRIALGPLERGSVAELLVDTLRCDADRAAPLAELAWSKTNGNPFFIREFLAALADDGVLSFNTCQGQWTWQLDRVRAQSITENVATLSSKRIKGLVPETRELLQQAACLGNRFDLRQLSIASTQPIRDTARGLWPAVTAGLLLPLSEDYRLANLEPDQLPDDFNVEYKFAHDQLQRATYELIPPDARPAAHWQLGQRQLCSASLKRDPKQIFAIVNQLNRGRNQATSDAESRELAELNLRASKAAKAASAYSAALGYAEAAIELLRRQGWSRDYQLCLELWLEAAEAAYAAARLERMNELAEEVAHNAVSTLDNVRAKEIQVQALIVQNRLPEAVELAVSALAQIGVSFPGQPTKLHLLAGLIRTKLALLGKRIEDLADLPEAKAPEALAARRLLGTISAVAYLANPDLFPLLVFKQIGLSMTQGNTADSPFAYALFGISLCGVLGDIDGGYRFGEIALELQERFDSKKYRAKTLMAVYHFIKPWKVPLRATLPSLRAAYDQAVEHGDLEYCAHLGNVHALNSFYAGKELGPLTARIAADQSFLTSLKQERGLYIYRILEQHIETLRGDNEDRTHRDELIEQLRKANDVNALSHIDLNDLVGAYLFGDIDRARESAARLGQKIEAFTGTIYTVQFHFYDSLTALEEISREPPRRRRRLLERVARNQKKMQKWATHAPSNSLHKFRLVAAERARISGKYDKARKLYDQAIAGATDNEYLNEQALAQELAARFYLSNDQRELASHYMGKALHTYRRWGANAKARDIENRYGDLLPTWAAEPEPRILSRGKKSAATTLDLQTLSKSAQAISSELVLDRLLEKLMAFAIENAGAQRGVLLLDSSGELVIEAEASDDASEVTVLRSLPVAGNRALPQSIIQYVMRTGEQLVLDNAGDAIIALNDPYISAEKSRSILCMPLRKQTTIVGLLYLENNLTTCAFSADRLELLQLLSSHIAISIENARLYAEMEQKVHERTRELQRKSSDLENALQNLRSAQARLIQSEKMASLGQLTAGIAHEIRNPLNFVTNFADLSVSLVGKLRRQLERYENRQMQEVQKEVGDTLDELQLDARKIHEHGQRASAIVERMLAHSRKGSGQPRPTEINGLMAEYLSLAEHGMKARRADYRVDVERDFDPSAGVIDVVPQSMGQVVLNLLENALDAMMQRCELAYGDYVPTLLVRTRRLPGNVEISVKDNGIGIAQDVIARVFEPFFTTKPAGSGTGLGLWLSYDIVVQEHGGELKVESEEGAYTEFRIVLPSPASSIASESADPFESRRENEQFRADCERARSERPRRAEARRGRSEDVSRKVRERAVRNRVSP